MIRRGEPAFAPCKRYLFTIVVFCHIISLFVFRAYSKRRILERNNPPRKHPLAQMTGGYKNILNGQKPSKGIA